LWLGCAVLVEVTLLVAALTLHLLAGWPGHPLLVLAVSSLPLALGIVLASSTLPTGWAETLVCWLVEVTGMAILVAAVYLLVIIGYGPTLDPREREVLGLSVISAALVAALWRPATHLLTSTARRAVYGVRYAPASVLRSFGTHLSRAVPMDELLLQAAESLRTSMALEAVEIWTGSGGTLERAVSVPERGARRIVLSASESAVVAAAGVSGNAWINIWLPGLLSDRPPSPTRVSPASHGGELLGLIVAVGEPGRDSFDATEDSVLAELGRQIGLALHNLALDSALQASLDEVRRQAEELRASRARIVAASDAARRRIERDLHDGAQQHLVALSVNLRLAQRLAASNPEAVGELLDELGKGLEEAVRELRALAHGIYPPLLVDRGLEEALRSAAGRAALPTEVEATGAQRYPSEVEAAVYFCCLEAMQNAAKHAGPGAVVTVRVFERDDELCFEVRDDGVGFDDASMGRTGSGFVNMGDRLGAIGGSLSVRSARGQGTTVSGRVPLTRTR
jgi:signal transduction histidine kinase